MKRSEVPAFPLRYSATPTTGDPSHFFPHPRQTDRWVVSPDGWRWVVYIKGAKIAVGWEDLSEPPETRPLNPFDPER
jgi:hypothetical protein